MPIKNRIDLLFVGQYSIKDSHHWQRDNPQKENGSPHGIFHGGHTSKNPCNNCIQDGDYVRLACYHTFHASCLPADYCRSICKEPILELLLLIPLIIGFSLGRKPDDVKQLYGSWMRSHPYARGSSKHKPFLLYCQRFPGEKNGPMNFKVSCWRCYEQRLENERVSVGQ